MITIKNSRLSSDYVIFASISIFVTIAFSGFFTFKAFKAHEESSFKNQDLYSARIEKNIQELFEFTNHINVYMGNQIAEHGSDDLDYIYSLFIKNAPRDDEKSLFSWSLFDWVDPNNRQLVNSKEGIRKDPPDMSEREYSWKSKEHPGTLQVSFPVFGNPSKMWVVPAGTGIVDKTGKFIGTIVVGFNVAAINEKLMQAFSDTNISFVVLDEHKNIVFQSADNSLSPSSTFFRDAFAGKNIFLGEHGSIKEKISTHDGINITYYHYRKIKGYPYTVVVGYPDGFLRNQFFMIIMPRLIEIFLVAVFFVSILFVFRKRLVSQITSISTAAKSIIEGGEVHKIPAGNTYETHILARQFVRIVGHIKREERYKKIIAQSKQEIESAFKIAKEATKARDEFQKRMRKNFFLPMIELTQAAIKIRNENLGPISNEYKELGEYIYKKVHLASTLINDTLVMRRVNPVELIHNCLSVHRDKAYENKINYICEVQEDIPVIELDEVCFSQILVSTIYQMLLFIPNEKTLNIKAFAQFKNTKNKSPKNLVIQIRDDGLGLDEAERNRKKGPHERFDGTDLSLSEIKKLVNMHGGIWKFEPVFNVGTECIIIIPYGGENYRPINSRKKKTTTNTALPKNVLRFPGKK